MKHLLSFYHVEDMVYSAEKLVVFTTEIFLSCSLLQKIALENLYKQGGAMKNWGCHHPAFCELSHGPYEPADGPSDEACPYGCICPWVQTGPKVGRFRIKKYLQKPESSLWSSLGPLLWPNGQAE